MATYLLTKAPRGCAVHLTAPGRETAVCGTPVLAREVQTWFSREGCRRCARVALARGTTWVADVDFDPVDLADYLTR